MKNKNTKQACYLTTLIATLSFVLVSCEKPSAPLDSSGSGPDEVLLSTYKLILAGDFSKAENSFSPEFLQEFVVSKGKTFEGYAQEYTKGWKPEWLKTEVMGNDYNSAVWRVKLIPDEGKGAGNGAGIVQDLAMMDGKWRIVFWGHFPKS